MTEEIQKKDERRKIDYYRFKNAIEHRNVCEMRQYIQSRPWNDNLESENITVRSEVIERNCIVLETHYVKIGRSYSAYFVGALGHVERIRMSGEHSKSIPSLVEWLNTDEFRKNKLKILANNILPIHENGREFIIDLCGGDEDHIYFKKHIEFMNAYNRYLQNQNVLKNI